MECIFDAARVPKTILFKQSSNGVGKPERLLKFTRFLRNKNFRYRDKRILMLLLILNIKRVKIASEGFIVSPT